MNLHGARPRLAVIVAVFTLATTLLDALPEAYFSADVVAPTDLAGWVTLSEAQPRRVRVERSTSLGDHDTPPASRLEVRPGIDYVRVRRLARDLGEIEVALESRRLIIDLRFVAAGQDESLRFGSLLARNAITLPAPVSRSDVAPLEIAPNKSRAADQITVILVNSGTSGPLEAVLAALQQSGDVLLVGTASAGDTGFFLPVPGFPTIGVISGEFVATRGSSLLERGVQPGLTVEVASADDETGYLALESGVSMADLLDPPVNKARFDEAMLLERHAGQSPRRARTDDDPPHTSEESPEPEAPPSDRILLRAVNTLIALDALKPAS